MNTSLTIQKGKFYRDGVPVPLEFGNKDQIRLMQEELRRIEAFKTGILVDVDIETTVKGEIHFKCECGQASVYFEQEADNEDDLDFVGDKSTCFKCMQKYEIKENDDGDLIAVKIK